MRKLEAGSYMKLNQEGQSTIVHYYQIDRKVTASSSDYQKNISTLKNLMEDSVRERMVADVPVGRF